MAKLFYNILLITIGHSALMVMIVIGVLSMLIPNLPYWLGVIGCLLVLAFAVIALMGAKAASSIVAEIDKKTKNKFSL